MTIAEFRARLASAPEGEGLFSALRKLARVEDPRRLVRGLPAFNGWPDWYSPAEPARRSDRVAGDLA